MAHHPHQHAIELNLDVIAGLGRREAAHVRDILDQQGGEEFDLALELAVNGLFGHAGLVGDRVHRCVLGQSIEEDLAGRGQYSLPGGQDLGCFLWNLHQRLRGLRIVIGLTRSPCLQCISG